MMKLTGATHRAVLYDMPILPHGNPDRVVLVAGNMIPSVAAEKVSTTC